jgi:hypothetical protein
LSVDYYLAIIGHYGAGDRFDQGSFSGAVLSHQRMNFTGSQFKRHAVQRMHTRIRLADPFGAQELVHGLRTVVRTSIKPACRSPVR